LVVQVGYEEFIERLARHRLPGGVFYKVQAVLNAEEANGVMERVRQYRV
jgi:hypothetical protein